MFCLTLDYLKWRISKNYLQKNYAIFVPLRKFNATVTFLYRKIYYELKKKKAEITSEIGCFSCFVKDPFIRILVQTLIRNLMEVFTLRRSILKNVLNLMGKYFTK